MPKLPLAATTLLLAGCMCPQPAPPSPSLSTQPNPHSISIDSNGGLSIGGGAISVQASDLPLLVKDVGPNRPVVLNGVGELKKMIAIRQQFQAAGFTNVAIAGE